MRPYARRPPPDNNRGNALSTHAPLEGHNDLTQWLKPSALKSACSLNDLQSQLADRLPFHRFNVNLDLKMIHLLIQHASFDDTLEVMTISLRNLPAEVEQSILDVSRREGISLNKATIRLLEASLRKPARNSDFDDLFGTWTKEEADEFDAALVSMRRVDSADWETVE